MVNGLRIIRILPIDEFLFLERIRNSSSQNPFLNRPINEVNKIGLMIPGKSSNQMGPSLKWPFQSILGIKTMKT